MKRRRLYRSKKTQYRCFRSPQNQTCSQCQFTLDTYEAHLPSLKKIIRARLGNPEEVEDYLHAFYVYKLSQKTHSFRPDDPQFNAFHYMARMLRNFMIDEKVRRSKHHIIDRFVSGMTYRDEDLILIDHVSTSNLYRDEIRHALSVLNPSEVRLILKVVSPGWNLADEARKAGIQLSAMRARVNRIRAKLRRVTSSAS
jgi:RNA polymerase sigma factor (sigma-70 family)